jgi:hypothetical protein
MGQGSYVICELDSVEKEYPQFQQALRSLEDQAIRKCAADWFPKLTVEQVSAKLWDKTEGFGRTTILPALFSDWWDGTVKPQALSVPLNSAQLGGVFGGSPVGTWRQLITASGNMVLLHGAGAGDTIAEDFKIAWIGLAFPNKQQHITEIKMQIGDRKYGRINLEEMLVYNKPAVIFEEGYIIEEEESFDLYGYVRGPIPTHHDGYVGIHQRIVMLGAAYYKIKDKILGLCGAAISTT